MGPPTFLNSSENCSKKCSKNHRKLPFLGSKIGGIGFTYIWVFPVLGKCCKMFRMLIEVGKSEKIIKIGPETAEIEQKLPKNAKIAKISKFGSDFKIAKIGLFQPIFWVFFRYLGHLWADFDDFFTFSHLNHPSEQLETLPGHFRGPQVKKARYFLFFTPKR